MRIQDLRPGDRLAGGVTDESATLISWSVPHPTYPGLALVVWRMGDGRVSIDALDPEQHDPSGSTLVPQSEDQRLESLRRAIEGPSTEDDDPGLPLSAVFDNVATRQSSVRHYIGLMGSGLRMSARLEGQFGAGQLRDPRTPMPLGRWKDPANEDGPLLYPVSAELAREWTGPDLDEDPDDVVVVDEGAEL